MRRQTAKPAPCVSFNKLNMYEWYRERVRKIDGGHDAEDSMEAFRLSLMWGESIPIGVIFRNRRPTYEERNPVISQAPLVEQAFDRSKLAAISREFTEAGTRGGWRILRRESEVLRWKRFEWRHQRWRVTKMSMKSYIIKEGTLRIQGGAANNPSKTLLTLYQRKGLDIARAGSPSPLAGVSGRPAGS